MRLHVGDLRDGYVDACRYVLERGQLVSPRGMLTREVMDAVIVLEDSGDSLPVGVGRKLNPAIGVVEALQLISGASYPELTCKIAPNMRRFMDGGTFHGSYGQRTRGQVARAIERLRADADTRQAVVTVWDPLHDLMVDGYSDYPCTVSLQFTIRSRKLQLHTHMRSNDVWWGLAYDAFQFTQLQLAVANVLELPAGRYFHHATSLHAYERDWEAIEGLHQCLPMHTAPERHYWRAGLGAAGGPVTWTMVAADAKSILNGEETAWPTEEFVTERWMRDVLADYR